MIDGGTVTELAVGIVAPGPQAAVRPERQSVAGTCIHRLPAGRNTNLHRSEASCGRAVTELAVGVVAPGPQAAVGPDTNGVIRARRHGSPESRTDTRWTDPAGRRAVTELAVGVVAPRPQAAIRLGRQGVEGTGLDGLPVLGRTHLHRNCAICGRAVAKLTEDVVAPRP